MDLDIADEDQKQFIQAFAGKKRFFKKDHFSFFISKIFLKNINNT